MKRILSLVLTLAILSTFIPTAFAEDAETSQTTGIKIVYNIGENMPQYSEEGVLFSSLTYGKTGGYWQYANNSHGLETTDNYIKWRGPNGIQFGPVGSWFAMRIQIPVSGWYKGEVKYAKFKNNGGRAWVSVLPINTVLETYQATTADVVCTPDCRSGSSDISWTDDSGNAYVAFSNQKAKYYEAGEYYLYYRHNSNGSRVTLGDFTLYSVDSAGTEYASYESVYMGIADVVDNTLTVGEATKVSATLTESIEHAAITNFTYTSSNEAVAKVVADGTVIAVGPGTATISATASGYMGGNVIGADITVSAPPTTDDVVSFSVAASESAATVTVEGITYDDPVESVARGTEVTLTANPLENYTFIGWKRGSNSTYNSYISNENPFTTKLYTNTYLTAVYIADTEEDKAVVEYYNQNGDYIDTQDASETTLPEVPAITGFTFEEGNWFVGENTPLVLAEVTKRTRAVAKHTAKENAGIVTVGTTTSEKTAFDSAITPVATEGFTCWKRDGKVVSYNREYTYYLWDNTMIEQSDEALPEGKKLPIIILDNDKVDGAYMIEYDAADYEIVEVGFVFSDTGTPAVESCSKKFTSQRRLSHGQMSAKYNDNVRGYLIYKDGNEYRVIYDSVDAQ